MARENMEKQNDGIETKAVSIRRVAKVTKGGKLLRFSAMVVAGDRSGSVGVAVGKGSDTRSAIEKAERKAKKNMKRMQLVGDTIPHELMHKEGAAKVLLRPAKPGTGVIAGSSVRTVLDLCGVENVYGKVLGSSDLIANAYATYEALLRMRNRRVLEKMDNMKERVHLKEQLDKERKEREIRRKKKAAEQEQKQDRKGGNKKSGKKSFVKSKSESKDNSDKKSK